MNARLSERQREMYAFWGESKDHQCRKTSIAPRPVFPFVPFVHTIVLLTQW